MFFRVQNNKVPGGSGGGGVARGHCDLVKWFINCFTEAMNCPLKTRSIILNTVKVTGDSRTMKCKASLNYNG